jgi:hypothetical protein
MNSHLLLLNLLFPSFVILFLLSKTNTLNVKFSVFKIFLSLLFRSTYPQRNHKWYLFFCFSELAMKHGLWGYAMHLASKMDQRTYANVMKRFSDGLAINTPLHTLLQLMSGHQPAAVTVCTFFSEVRHSWHEIVDAWSACSGVIFLVCHPCSGYSKPISPAFLRLLD